jgi:hypothetical protein
MTANSKQQYSAEEIARGWARFRVQVAGALIFAGTVALFALAKDQVFESQRPTWPLAALTLGPALIAAGCFLLLCRRKPPTS